MLRKKFASKIENGKDCEKKVAQSVAEFVCAEMESGKETEQNVESVCGYVA